MLLCLEMFILQLEEFLSQNPNTNLAKMALTTAQANVRWFKRNSALLRDMLARISPKETFNLPTEIRPHLYELEIRPYICDAGTCGWRSMTFEGKVKMHLTCFSATNMFRFHSVDLAIEKTEMSSSKDTDIGIRSLVYDEGKEWYTVHLNKACVPGANYELLVIYTGQISSKLYGFYGSSYFDPTSNRTM